MRGTRRQKIDNDKKSLNSQQDFIPFDLRKVIMQSAYKHAQEVHDNSSEATTRQMTPEERKKYGLD